MFKSKKFSLESENSEEVLRGEKSRRFFYKFLRKFKEELKIHNEFGLWPKKEGWNNVIKHCAVVAVAAETLAEELKVSENDKKKLIQAAFLHDFYKRRSKTFEKTGTFESMKQLDDLQVDELVKSGIEKDVAELTLASGFPQNHKFEGGKASLVEKIMKYIDNITLETKLAPLLERMDAVKNRNKNQAEGGFIDALTEESKKIEMEFARILGLSDKSKLPEYLANKIQEKIDAEPLGSV